MTDHGSDDDLKLLNLIESYWKPKLRQSVNLNQQEIPTLTTNKSSTTLAQPQKQPSDCGDHMRPSRSNDDKLY